MPDASPRLISTAIVCERIPLFRDGLVAVLRASGLFVVAETTRLSDGLDAIADLRPHLFVIGDLGDVPQLDALLGARTRSPRILCAAIIGPNDAGKTISSLAHASCEALVGRLSRATVISQAIDALRSGEHFVAPELVPLIGLTTIEREDFHQILTDTEVDVLRLVAKGMSNRDVAQELGRGPETVKTHLRHIYEKLGVHDRRGAIERAVSVGILG